MSTFKEYLSEALFDDINHNKTECMSMLHYVDIIASKGKMGIGREK